MGLRGSIVTLAAALILSAIVSDQLLVVAYNNGLARLPPMGWNTWCTDDLCGAIDYCAEQEIRSVADSIVEQGLDKLGYRYINLDDCWSAHTRNETGHLQPNPILFPSGMRALADYIHSLGLYIGLYTCIGTETCRRHRPGSYGHFQQDAETLANWGIDFVKTDNCHRVNNQTEEEQFTELSNALNSTGRPMVFSLCEWGNDYVENWGGKISQMWRIQMDHIPFWHFPGDAAGRGFGQGTADVIEFIGTLDLSNKTGPYNHMDPDFLETLFPLTFTFIDSRTEFSFWSLWSAPLIVATDMRNLSSQKQEILTNEEVIAIDQDELSITGHRIYNESNGAQAWVKPLVGDDLAVILYNSHNHNNITVTVTWEQVGLDSTTSVRIRDLWKKSDLGNFSKSFTSHALVPHDVQMLRFFVPKKNVASS
eukprot:gene6997-7629_t